MRTSNTALTVVLFTLLAQGFASGEDAKSLQALIDAAPAGGEVTIPKGEYKEPIKIDKALTLRGEDRDGCVVDVVSDGPAVRFAHKGEAILENVTVRWMRETSVQSQEPQAAVVARDAKLVLRNVRVVAPENPARCPSGFLAIGFCDVKLEACEFEGFEFTVAFEEGAKGSVTDCIVSKSGRCGITAGPDTTVNVLRSIVTGSRFHGIRCTGGELNAKHNVIVDNKNRGVYLGNKPGRGTIEENVIQGNGTGISAFGEAEVRVENNYIAGNDFAAVDMRDGCRLDVKQNLLAKNGRGVVLFKESGRNRNTVGKNASAGNTVEAEGFETAPDFHKVEGDIPEGEFASEKASGFGLTDPAKIKPVWERWTAMRERAAAE